MIADERQYRATKAQARRLERALRRRKEPVERMDPSLRRATTESIESQMDVLREDVAEYERLKASTLEDLELGSLNELPLLLVRAGSPKDRHRKAWLEGSA